MERILMIGAHFDDVELGAGGSAAALVAQGRHVYKLTLTDNVTRSKHLDLDISYDSSRENSARACKEIGVVEISDYQTSPCNQLVYSSENMQKIEAIIFENKIDTVFLHFHSDLNQDHMAASELCKTAARHCKNILMYQSNLYVLPMAYYPTIFFDITPFINMKISALKQYDPQHNRFNRLFESTIKRNEVWGYQIKTEYAEAFHAVKLVLGS
jgi:N-acetylglucosamine malate deacetylase 1